MKIQTYLAPLAWVLSLSTMATPCVKAQSPVIAPDAGRLLQEQWRPPAQPLATATPLDLSAPTLSEVIPGGTQVTLRAVTFAGNTRFSQAQLQAVVVDSMGVKMDLGGLRELANRVSVHYRDAGYPFARAFIAPQGLQGGEEQATLRIDVLEGVYGQINVLSADVEQGHLTLANRYTAQLTPGSVIESEPLERLSLTLSDLPGFKVTPIMRPGQALGTGDLDLSFERAGRWTADVGVDNQGNRYTGQNRLRANLDWNSPFFLGDQVTLRSVLSDHSMWMATLGYSLPIGGAGLRANASYAHTYYELGGSFSDSQSNGQADVLNGGLSYPLLRSQRANATLSGSLQYKKLNDRVGATGSSAHKSSMTLPLNLNADLRDSSGITYGSVGMTGGRLKLDGVLTTTDAQAQTAGGFNKINLNVARVQSLPWGPTGSFTLFARLSTQHASKNLDSSEDFGLGGSSGVRAYPSGEGYGDAGWLTQLELRYTKPPFAPYVFYDAGSVRVNAKPWTAAADAPAIQNTRKIAGVGLGLRYQSSGWNLDVALAWRTTGGLPQSDAQDTRKRGPQAWFSAGYQF